MADNYRSAVGAPDTLVQAFLAAVGEQDGQRVAFRRPDGAEVSWREYGEQVAAAADALAGSGVTPGDRVLLMLRHRVEFHYADMAAMCLGATPFSAYDIASVSDVVHVLEDADPRVVVTESGFVEQLRAAGAHERAEVVVVDEPEGATWPPTSHGTIGELADRARTVRTDDIATIIYTSGTTGAPKGVELTHGNVLALCRGLGERAHLAPGMRVVSYLPMAHIAERLCSHYFPAVFGWTVTLCPDASELATALAATAPHFFFAPPRLWEKLRVAVEGAPEAQRRDRIQQMGLGEVVCAYIGASPVPSDLVLFWRTYGLPLCEEYGQSECTGVATANPLDDVRVGTVGTALPGVELRIADDGEVLIRGDIVMPGYRNLPEETAATVDADGWLWTGDLGRLDEDGYLTIVDRKKEIIVNSMGKNMSPSRIESAIGSASSLIAVACVHGDARPYNTALVNLDPDAVAAFAREHGISGGHSDLVKHPLVADEVARAIAEANTTLSSVERVERWLVVEDDWTPGGDELTPTMKLRRRVIARKYAQEVEDLYALR